MKKTLVIYWSGTGNTEAMAGAVLEGMKAAGADAALLTPDQVTPASLSGVSSVAMGCPAMGSEVLEEMEFQPMFDSITCCEAPDDDVLAACQAMGRKLAE